MNFIETIRKAIAGKKTYLLAWAAIIGTVVAWSEGTIGNAEALIAVGIALQTVFIRLGIAKSVTEVETAVRVVEADKKIEQVDDTYEIEALAHSKLMSAQAENVEFQNSVNQQKLQAAQKQAEIVQVVEQVVDKKLQEQNAPPDSD